MIYDKLQHWEAWAQCLIQYIYRVFVDGNPLILNLTNHKLSNLIWPGNPILVSAHNLAQEAASNGIITASHQ